MYLFVYFIDGRREQSLLSLLKVHDIVPTSAFIVELEKVFINGLQLNTHLRYTA